MPRATFALLFSDIEGSTRLLQQLGPAYADVLLTHRAALRTAFAAYHGEERGTEGDSFFVTFPTAADAVAAALTGQLALSATAWPDGGAVKVRMGVHVGPVEIVADTVLGLAVHEAARIAAAAHGGQVLASETAAALADPLPRDAQWRDLGYHRLKDIPEPRMLVQLAHPELAADFPPPRADGSGRNNLPTQPTSFVGRAEEIAAIDALLQGSSLVTITGTGGVGKSRIALRVAAVQGQRYRDGVWLVDLTRIGEPAAVEAQVAATLSLGDVTGDALTERLADQRLLLVLDNCEHVIDGAADLAARLVKQCPSVTVLTTSREPLGVAGETVWRVPPLRIDEGVELLAVRAQAVGSAFAVNDGNRATVRDVCARLDAIPLALELAAARLASLTVEQLASRLDQRFRLLAGGARGTLERHRTLQATVDWSYDLLDPGERAVLRRLGVFTGGFELDAAECVCDDRAAVDVLDLVDRLVAKSLVVAEQKPGGMRYRLLETVRQYAVDRLAQAGEVVAARDAQLSWVVRLAEAAETTLWLGGDESAWLGRLDDEDANIRAGLEWALERDDPATAAWILFGVFGWMTARGRAREGLELTRRVLAMGITGPQLGIANLLLMCFESNAGELDPETVAAAQATAPALEESRHPWLRAVTDAYTTAWSYPAGDAEAAAACVDRCRATVDLVASFGPGVTAWCLQPLIWVNLDAGRLEDARTAADAGLAAASAARLSIGESRMALNRGRIALAENDLDGAWAFAERAIVAARRTGETFVASTATQLLADVADRRGERALARDLLVSVLDAVAESQPPAAAAALRKRISTYA